MKTASILVSSISCAVFGILSAAPTKAASLISSNFSIGYGFTGVYDLQNPNTDDYGWKTWEIADGINTPTTIGDFSFIPTLTGDINSFSGPSFPDRVLSFGPGQALSGSNWDQAPGFQPPQIMASYNGPTPDDAAVVPNYQLTLDITSISVYVTRLNGDEHWIGWTETTPGHLSDSPTVTTLPTGPGVGNQPSSYVRLVWDPADFSVPGITSARTFTTTSDQPSGLFALDGFEVEGRVTLTYDAIPEPASLSLLALSGLLVRRQRR